MTDYIRVRYIDSEAIELIPSDQVMISMHHGMAFACANGDTGGAEISSAVYITEEELRKEGFAFVLSDLYLPGRDAERHMDSLRKAYAAKVKSPT